MNWQVTPLDDLLCGVIDYRGRTPPKSTSGVRLVTAKVIKSGQVVEDGPQEYIDENIYDDVMRRGEPRRKDILITTEAPLGEVALWDSDERIALAQRVILLRPNPKVADPRFLFYYLRTGHFRECLRSHATGTTVPGIKNPVLRAMPIRHPDMDSQRRIGNVLGAYDELISINQRRIVLLEEAARRLYREWFVHLRFPGHESVSVKFGVPENWKIEKLGSVADINRRSLKLSSAPEFIDYIDISSVSRGTISTTDRLPVEEAPGRARRCVQHGDVIWSCVRPNLRAYALIWEPAVDVVVSTGFAVLSATGVPSSYLYLLTTTDEFIEYLEKTATGAAYPAVTARAFEDAQILVPGREALDEFDEIAAPMLAECETLKALNAQLSKARDLLLPKLMSGQLDVSRIPLPDEAAA